MSTRIDAHQLVIIAYYGVNCFEHKVFCFLKASGKNKVPSL